MNYYTQITNDERVIIADLWKRKKTYYYIAKWLKRKYDTIKDEIEKNGEYNQFKKIIYSSKKAQKNYLIRRKKSKKENRIIENNFKIEKKITELIVEDQLSPEQISNRFKTVSHQTIYNWIYKMESKFDKKRIVKNLRRKGKTYRKTSKLHSFQSIVAPKTMIDQRLEIINKRERLGDFEGDLIKLNGKEVLYTLVDRKSRYTFIRYLTNGYADLVNLETVKIWKKDKKIFKSITFDNGSEFSKHDLLTLDTKIKIYFCFPYHSWEKGTNENTNGLIRQYYPKKKIYDKILESDIKTIQDKLNNRPRKCLNWLTPHEVFVKKMKVEDFQVQALI